MLVAVRQHQTRLQSLYGFESGIDASDFVVNDEGRRTLQAMLSQTVLSREALVISETAEDLLLALVLDDELHSADALDDGDLDRHCALLEGVSHLLYVANRASAERQLTLLELELQAEVDKFLSTWLARWEAGAPVSLADLRNRLFRQFRIDPQRDEAAQHRYLAANRLAERYCRHLHQNFLATDRFSHFWPEIRRFWRMSQADKIGHIECRL